MKLRKELNRREFIDLGIKTSAGIGLGPTFLAFGSSNAKTVHGACYHDCPDACSWTVTAVNGKITQFEASRSNPYTAGKLSLMANGWARLNLPSPWIPHAEGKFATSSQKCEFVSKKIPGLPEYHPVAHGSDQLKKYPLQLLAIKSTRNFLNTSHANIRHLLQKEGTPYLDIHKNDAEARNIAEGDQVKVFNDRGKVILTARIQGKVRSGVVCMPQGFWSSLMRGGSSANALTTDLLTDMGNGSALQETIVQVVKLS